LHTCTDWKPILLGTSNLANGARQSNKGNSAPPEKREPFFWKKKRDFPPTRTHTTHNTMSSSAALAKAEAAEAEARAEVEQLLAARCAAWAEGGGLVRVDVNQEFESTSTSTSTLPDPEADPEAWLAHPQLVRTHLTRTHGSLRRILRRAREGEEAQGGGFEGGVRGLARVDDFLPRAVARFAANALANSTPASLWEPTGVAGASRFHSTSNHGPNAPPPWWGGCTI
jgi:hypothetical protein